MIDAVGLSKDFRVSEKAPGLLGSLKSFVRSNTKSKNAVRNFDFSVKQGEFVALLGPNGAGKTTLMKMLSGLIVPTSGSLSVLGHVPSRRDRMFRKKIALVMGQKSQLWWDIPAMDSFLLLKAYYEISASDFKHRIDELTELLGVAKVLTTPVRRLSLGERMKVELMASLLHKPDLMLLDEPTIGLDLVAQRNIRSFLKDYQRRAGTTMILTSHYMADVEALCDRIVLVLEGEKRYDGPITKFEGILGREKFVTVSFSSKVDPRDKVFESLHPEWTDDGLRVELRIGEQSLRHAVIDLLSRFPVTDVATEKLPIERVMATLLQRPELLRGADP